MATLQASVNKSGSTINVYDTFSGSNRKVVGQLLKNEVFVIYGSEGSLYSIRFKGPSGSLISGCINDSTDVPNDNWAENIYYYPFGTETINGRTYRTFKFRRSATILKANGSNWGTVASGMLVATTNGTVGQSNNGHKHINYVKQSGTNAWVEVSGGGFVDMGFSHGSSGSNMSMYGTY